MPALLLKSKPLGDARRHTYPVDGVKSLTCVLVPVPPLRLLSRFKHRWWLVQLLHGNIGAQQLIGMQADTAPVPYA